MIDDCVMYKPEAKTMKNIFFILICLVATPICRGRTITVDDDGPADFDDIQAAIDDANDGDTVEILPGTYTGPGNRDIDFLGKAITVRSTDPNDANTVASAVIDCARQGQAFLFQNSEDAHSVLDGLTITNPYGGGSAIYCAGSGPALRNCVLTSNWNGDQHIRSGQAVLCIGGSSATIDGCVFTRNSTDFGGAINCYQSTCTITNCVFCGNYAERKGGAVRVKESIATISDCTFEDNSAGQCGGAIDASYSELTLKNCLFARCWSSVGGGLYCYTYGTNTTVTNCRFVGNFARRTDFAGRVFGGGMSAGGGTISLANCLFAGNSAPEGAGLYAGFIYSVDNMTVANCTFAGNYAERGSTLYCVQGGAPPLSNIHIRNSIIRDGPDSIFNAGDSIVLVTSCDIPGAWPGYENIDADPCFFDPGGWVHRDDPNIIVEPNSSYAVWVNGDYHLKSQGGRWDAHEGRWVKDDVTSACIDAAHPMSAIGGETFPNGGRLNMGAYGGTGEASKSYFGKAPCEIIMAGDINGDCVVDGVDFALIGRHWLRNGKLCLDRATRPNPRDGGTDVPIEPILNWTPGCEATSHTVRFGTNDPPQHKGTQDSTFFRPYVPNTLKYNQRYYWRIDERGPNGTTRGRVWTFKTAFRLDPATYPDPADGAGPVSGYPELSWTAGVGATSHDVYFGTSSAVVFQGNQEGTTFEPFRPGPFNYEYDHTYYWRIDERNADGITPGAVWSFTTRPDRG